MKIKNLEKFIRNIQKSFSKAGITTVIEKGLPPYDAYEIQRFNNQDCNYL